MRARAIVLAAAAALVAGCVTSMHGSPTEMRSEEVPDFPRLRARIEALAAANIAGDDEAAYEIHSPALRAMTSFADFKSEREGPRSAQLTFHSVTPCSCGEATYPPEVSSTRTVLRCVLLIDASVIENSKEERSRFLMAWDRIDGEWYYLLSEEGDGCPSR